MTIWGYLQANKGYTLCMAIPNIDTFEHDIKEEIKKKEATVGDIASASGDIGNTPLKNGVENSNSRIFFILGGTLIGVGIVVAFSYLGYVYVTSRPTTQEQAATIVATQEDENNTEEKIKSRLISYTPSLADIAHYVSKVDQNQQGVTLTLKDYTAVFAFMLQNETLIAENVLGKENVQPVDSTSTPRFEDITKSNQNMRVIEIGQDSFVYAFIGDQYLVFATSPENVLQLRGLLIK